MHGPDAAEVENKLEAAPVKSVLGGGGVVVRVYEYANGSKMTPPSFSWDVHVSEVA